MSQSAPRPSDPLPRIIAEHLQALVAAVTAAVRDSVADEIAALLAGGGSPAAGQAPRILPCRAPGCDRPSRGPRFHFLCEEHRRASARQIEAWRQAAKQAEARAREEEAARRIKAAGPALPGPRILPCIAPGCDQPSKGPRFHYLCEEHRRASKREWTAWRKARERAAR